MSEDPFALQRFVDAQEAVYPQVCAELRRGRKVSHWMWFIFPQLRGLGSSATAQHFGIASTAEARAYLEHPVLGPRLRETTTMVNEVEGQTIERIFGYPDYLKFRSCMTLFAHCADDPAVFAAALTKYFGGEPDPVTLNAIQRTS